MKVLINIPALNMRTVGEWDGQYLRIAFESPVELTLDPNGRDGLMLQLEPAHGPCACGRGDIFFPPMCEQCWTEYQDTNNIAARVAMTPSHDVDPPLKALPQGSSTNRQDPTWDPGLLEGWTWEEPKAKDPDVDGDGEEGKE
jgi:hypothetical protein